MGRSRGPQLDQDVQEAAHMLAEGCGTPVSAAVSAALDAQNEHPACREAAIRELEPENAAIDTQLNAIPAVIPHSACNSLFWLDPAEDNAQ